MDETIYVIFKAQFDFVLEVWFSIASLAFNSLHASKFLVIFSKI